MLRKVSFLASRIIWTISKECFCDIDVYFIGY
jgi:hypothetical protein